jgi:hypothetical protein
LLPNELPASMIYSNYVNKINTKKRGCPLRTASFFVL